MIRYVLKRLVQGIIVLFVVSLISFFALKVIPGDPASLVLGTEASPESLAILRESMGLNQPYLTQYLTWVKGVLVGDLGRSYYFGQSVLDLILQRLPLTIVLALYASLISFLLAMVLGMFAAIREGKWSDTLIRLLSQASGAIPSFWLGILFLNYFGARLGWFPITGEVDFSQGIGKSLWTLTMPAIVLSLVNLGPLTRQFRNQTIQVLNSDYIMGARIRGLSKFKIITKYLLRSVLITPLSMSSLQLAGLFGGTAVTEQVFSLSGIGRLLVIAVEQRDLMLLQGLTLVICAIVVLISVINDILISLIDPNVKLEGGSLG